MVVENGGRKDVHERFMQDLRMGDGGAYALTKILYDKLSDAEKSWFEEVE